MEIPLLLGTFGKSLLFAVATVLPIVNPLATAPMFTTLTHGVDEPTRADLSRRIGRHVAMLLIGATLVGSYVLDFFGISLPIVRVAGGLIVASTAWRMLHTQQAASDDKAIASRAASSRWLRCASDWMASSSASNRVS